LAYNSEVDALRQLLLVRKYGGSITGSPGSLKTLPNGLPYYYVEVTTKDKTKYVIEAYGEDATKLKNESLSMREELVVLA
jgi:hypothetical protein